jgi:hypothetical protein
VVIPMVVSSHVQLIMMTPSNYQSGIPEGLLLGAGP